MNEATTPSRQSARRMGQHLKSGLTNYVDHWQEWIVPTLVAGAITVASILCCWVPYLIVAGPVTCGMYCCALKTMRGGFIDIGDLKRGWRSPGRAILAAFVVNVGTALPLFLFYGLFLGIFGLAVALAPEPDHRQGENESPAHEEIVAEADIDAGPQNGEQAADDVGERTLEAAANQPKQHADEQSLASEPRLSGQPEEPSPKFVLGMIAGMCIFYALMFLAIIACWLWMLWFGTRTMFVLPLIADRQYSFGEAWRQSWRETHNRFWELAIVNFVAGVLGMLGMYAMYVGLIFTMPIMFSILVCVYDERFPSPGETEPKPSGEVC